MMLRMVGMVSLSLGRGVSASPPIASVRQGGEIICKCKLLCGLGLGVGAVDGSGVRDQGSGVRGQGQCGELADEANGFEADGDDLADEADDILGIVSGHGFSRADKANQINGGL